MNFTILMPAYLPSTKYFKYFINCNVVLLADHFQYVKRSTITRSSKLGNGKQLTIPVRHSGGNNQKISQKRIAPVEMWNKRHLKTLRHLYHSYPYFDEYYFKINTLYKNSDAYLSSFLLKYTKLILSTLKIKCAVQLTSNLNFSSDLDNSLIQFSQENKADFLYKEEDIRAGWLNLNILNDNDVNTKLFTEYNKKIFEMNILEYLFHFGPEAAFRIREA